MIHRNTFHRFAKGASSATFGSGWVELLDGRPGYIYEVPSLVWLADPGMVLHFGNASDGDVLRFPGAVQPLVLNQKLGVESGVSWFTENQDFSFQVTGSASLDNWFFTVSVGFLLV